MLKRHTEKLFGTLSKFRKSEGLFGDLSRFYSNPIKPSKDYNAHVDSSHSNFANYFNNIPRNLLMVDELPQGAYARYERMGDNIATFLTNGNNGDGQPFCATTVRGLGMTYVPTFEVSMQEYRINSVIPDLTDSFNALEELAFHNVLEKWRQDNPSRTVFKNSLPSDNGYLALISQGFAEVERSDLVVGNILTNENTYSKAISPIHRDSFSRSEIVFSRSEIDNPDSNLRGELFGANIRISNLVPNDIIYILAPPEYVGVIPVRENLTEIVHEDILNNIAYESIGMGILNNHAISVVDFNGVEKSNKRNNYIQRVLDMNIPKIDDSFKRFFRYAQ